MTTVDQIAPIHNHLIIRFIDQAGGGEFISKTTSGITLVRQGDEQGDARWAQVVKAGPDVDEDIKEGLYVLVEPKQWTVGLRFEDDTVLWRTDDKKILLTSEEPVYRY